MKKFISSFFALVCLTVLSFNANAVGCPSECRSEEGQPLTGVCIDANSAEGGKECTIVGIGEKTCNGTWIPTGNCKEQ